MDPLPYQGLTLTRWRVGQSTFLALPERGARLMNWSLELGDGSIRDVIHWPENADVANFPKIRGGNPILFPFAGRTYDQGEQNFWRAPDGARRPMPQHGFARQGHFKLAWTNAHGFAAHFVPDDEARAAYPFDYEFTVTYRFEPLGLVCELSLKNLGEEPLPWCPGHHFYFTVPWTENATRADYAIRVPATERWKHDPSGQLVPGPKLSSQENLTNPALLDTIHTGLRSAEVVFGEKNRPGDIRLRLGTDNVPPPNAAFVTWTADDQSPFYCVEPWMGPPNAPEHHRGLQRVAPRETGTFTVRIDLI